MLDRVKKSILLVRSICGDALGSVFGVPVSRSTKCHTKCNTEVWCILVYFNWANLLSFIIQYCVMPGIRLLSCSLKGLFLGIHLIMRYLRQLYSSICFTKHGTQFMNYCTLLYIRDGLRVADWLVKSLPLVFFL